mgnify:CR=1 FL=1
MKNRIVEIATDGVHISASRGFIVLNKDQEKLGQIAIDDMAALIIRGYGSTLSVNICARLSSANIPIIICGSNQSPSSVLWPLSGHHAQGRIMQGQSELTRPQKKRLWQSLIRAKITAQAEALILTGETANDIKAMVKRVKSGDSDNLEAQAARRYWSRLMGEGFRRDRAESGENAALNYGYTILRAATARAIIAAGLHPSLSIHHESRGDALRLADDMMEPFRPWVDLTVWQNKDKLEAGTLSPTLKASLVDMLSLDLQTSWGASPLQLCLERMAQSFAAMIMGERAKLDLPGPPVLALARQTVTL